MKRTVIAVLMLALAGLSSPAGAVETVTPAELPTIEQTAAIYPALAGGSRQEPLRHRRIEAPNKTCDGSRRIIRAESGLWTSYVDAEGETIYFNGEEDPTVFRYRLDSRPTANRTLNRLLRAVRPCLGTRTVDGQTVRLSGLRRIKVGGQDAVVWRHQLTHNVGQDFFVELWVVDGTDLVNVRAQKSSGWPTTTRVRKLARATAALA